MYNAVCCLFREVVFKHSEEQTIALAVEHTKLIRDLTDEYSAKHGTQFRYEYSPETFSQSDIDFSVRVCEAVKAAWGKHGTQPHDRLIINLPATVEIGPPNHWADQVRPRLLSPAHQSKRVILGRVLLYAHHRARKSDDQLAQSQ
jgi:2-isopropylmalate synthase